MALLTVKNLTTRFYTRNGISTAVNNASFSVDANETLAIVGESGSGKSVSCYSLLGLIAQPPGKIDSGVAEFNGRDLLQMNEKQLRQIRGSDISMIFQDPMTCLNPFLTIGEQLIEPLVYHRNCNRSDARRRAISMLGEVGITQADSRMDCYPHEFSGGMRQRVMIAMALITEPKLLIADEPTTALDVTIQAQILGLIKELQQRRKIAVIVISHDLAVVADIADRVLVMLAGEIVEQGSADAIFNQPRHQYTQTLLNAIPTGPKATGHSHTSPDQNKRVPVLQVSALKTWFEISSGQWFRRQTEPVKAVDEVSLTLNRGEVVGLVGESGSGKSTLGRSILQLQPVSSGSVRFNGTELTTLAPAQLNKIRRQMQMIFQDPYGSLNPRMSVFDTLAEPLLYHGLASKETVTQQVLKLVDEVGLQQSSIRKYPHEFSGGQRQRIAIGRAIATKPELLIADEPVSALDVTIQAQILQLLLQLVEKYNLTMLFISHDLSVVRKLCDRVLVMNNGRIVESADTEALYARPRHPYTQSLMSAIPLLGAS